MTAQKHPVFEAPENPDIKIWRYMDFTKYVSLLETQSLFFSRSDKFSDPYEGATSHTNVLLHETEDKKIPRDFFAQLSRVAEWQRQWTFINCWHMNNHESAALWKLYASANEAVALQSTYTRLWECLPEKVYVGKVHYIDYDTDWLPENNAFYPFVHKRKSFEYERELRALFQEIPDDWDMEKSNQESGRFIPVNLKSLIEKIYVAPTSQSWFTNLVQNVTKKYGIEIDVTVSSLDKKPVF